MSIHPIGPDAADRHLRLPGTRNLRDVGGYPAGNGRRTRWRTLYRTDALDRLPSSSQVALIDLGLRQVIDLRWPNEIAEAPSVFGRSGHVHYRSIPLLDNAPAPPAGPAAVYRRILDTRTQVLAAVVLALLRPDGLPAVIGCMAGVDRTGISIAVLLSAVGVPIDVVAADYGLSAQTYAAIDLAPELGDDWRAGPVTLDCVPEYMRESLEHLERRHGGARALLRRAGLTEAELDRLTDLLTETIAS